MTSKIKSLYLLKTIFLIMTSIAILIILYLDFSIGWQKITMTIVLTAILIYNVLNSLRMKEIRIGTSEIEITHIFKFKTEIHSFDNIQNISSKMEKRHNMNGPNIIDFPDFVFNIETYDGKKYSFNAKENQNVSDIYLKLKEKPSS